MMQIRWSRLLINIIVWTTAEVTLNFIGLDTLADYSEFLNSRHQIIQVEPAITYR